MPDIASRSKLWFAFSLIIIACGLASFATRGFNFGIDFTGGSILDLHFEQPVNIAAVRDALRPLGLDNATIQLAADSNDASSSNNVMIRTVDLDEPARLAVIDALRSVDNFDLLRFEKVGATIGSELISNALLALLISWALIIAYIAFRFEFNFGIAAVLALIHDILIVLAIFSFTQKQIDSSFVAALLTIVGYSINDTIVIFDRIRENLKLHFKRSGNLADILNRSIAQTLTRSIYTVCTCLFTTLALYFFGGDTTRDFAFALTVGFIFGCYSSIFIAGPLWLTLRNLGKK